VLVYGFVINLTNFAADQGYIQRYLTAKSERDAARSVTIGAWLYLPVAAVFFLIGTELYAWSIFQPDALPTGIAADQVFPWFIANRLPIGLAGLVVAGVFAAAMDPSLNSMATLVLRDLYQGYLRPQPTEREALWVLRSVTALSGLLAIAVALAMTRSRSILEAWWTLAGVFNGGVLGLVILGRFPRERVGRASAALAVGCGIVVISWMTLSPLIERVPGWAKNPLHPFCTPVVGTAVILAIGSLEAIFKPRSRLEDDL